MITKGNKTAVDYICERVGGTAKPILMGSKEFRLCGCSSTNGGRRSCDTHKQQKLEHRDTDCFVSTCEIDSHWRYGEWVDLQVNGWEITDGKGFKAHVKCSAMAVDLQEASGWKRIGKRARGDVLPIAELQKLPGVVGYEYDEEIGMAS